LLLLVLASSAYVVYLDAYRGLAYVAMGLALAAVSYVVYYKRLEFLAAGSTHAALFAAVVGLLAEHYTGVSYLAFSLPAGLSLVYAAGFMVKKGSSPGKAAAVVVSAASALAVLSAHYVFARVPARVSLSALILGDPLLLTRSEALVATVVSAALVSAALAARRVVVELSVDPVSVELAGVKAGLYELASYTLIGVAAVGLLRLAGYVMEHVLLLLPAIAASAYSSSTREHMLLTLLLGAFSASLGYVVGVVFNTVPTGASGLLLIGALLLRYLMRWVRSGR
jgi:zinc/manganese transport system permease protein